MKNKDVIELINRIVNPETEHEVYTVEEALTAVLHGYYYIKFSLFFLKISYTCTNHPINSLKNSFIFIIYIYKGVQAKEKRRDFSRRKP